MLAMLVNRYAKFETVQASGSYRVQAHNIDRRRANHDFVCLAARTHAPPHTGRVRAVKLTKSKKHT